jgi:hypothetical protein
MSKQKSWGVVVACSLLVAFARAQDSAVLKADWCIRHQASILIGATAIHPLRTAGSASSRSSDRQHSRLSPFHVPKKYPPRTSGRRTPERRKVADLVPCRSARNGINTRMRRTRDLTARHAFVCSPGHGVPQKPPSLSPVKTPMRSSKTIPSLSSSRSVQMSYGLLSYLDNLAVAFHWPSNGPIVVASIGSRTISGDWPVG